MSLAANQLALTFDDGPGSRTAELSTYLNSQGIHATFFINGHCFDQYNPCGNGLAANNILLQLKNDGHLIANHTQDHYDLTDATRFPSTPEGDTGILNELSQTHSIIEPFVDQGHFLFRPPYGNWDQRSYQLLGSSSMNKYLGPVRWDIGGMMTDTFAADWDCWQNTSGKGIQTSSQCGDRYLNEVRSVGRGIVLMHDSDQINATIGNTVDMIKYLIPILKSQGYSFVRADQVPELYDRLDPPPPQQNHSDYQDGSEDKCSDANILDSDLNLIKDASNSHTTEASTSDWSNNKLLSPSYSVGICH